MKHFTTRLSALAAAALIGLPLTAQGLRLYGVAENNRQDDGEQMPSKYVGWNSELGKSIFVVSQGIYTMTWNGSSLTSPEKDPAVNISDFYSGGQYTDNERAIWANNFNLMYGNSGAVYVNGKIVTVMSRDEQSTVDDDLFAVRKWDAHTGDLLSTEYRPKSANLESAGMSYNPADGKVYGLFYITEAALDESITSDPEYFTDDDDADAGREGMDAGYAICTIDLATMKVTPVTPGLYYYNFVAFAINNEGRAFALTSGGSAGYEDEDGRIRNIDGNLAGAQLCEFDLSTGLMITEPVEAVDEETGETYTDYVNIYHNGTGYCSQYRRQSACFDRTNPDKMYWIGYVNSGKGINEYGSWSSLSDKEWRTNGKYDTALYEVDVNTGVATRLALVPDRWTFSCLWVDGNDPSDDSDYDPLDPGFDPGQGAFIALQQADGGCVWQPVEIGKHYTYYIEPAEGWTVHSVTFNGNELTIGEGSAVQTPAISAERNRLVVVFEQVVPSAIRETSLVDGDIRVVATADGLRISGAQGRQLTVSTADGRVVRQGVVAGPAEHVALSPATLYIVRVGSKVLKVRF